MLHGAAFVSLVVSRVFKSQSRQIYVVITGSARSTVKRNAWQQEWMSRVFGYDHQTDDCPVPKEVWQKPHCSVTESRA